jgi:2-C-methyl-D-erythritol 4-phosphate cytidylyltransferase/2-C-methyl-D-erythritol 2,4-cyclodiphosphate synthase
VETAVVIVAAGRGTRAAGNDIPKQYRSLAGTPVLTRAIKTFSASLDASSIVTVIHPDDRDHYTSAVAPCSGQLRVPVMGGATRQLSVRAGLESLSDVSPRHVLIHDAARPFADADLISRVIAGLADNDGVVPALAVTDTLKRARGGVIEGAVERTNLWGVQTPQGFHFNKLLEAHRAAANESATRFTDDSSVAEWHGLRVGLVEGSPMNIKLTTSADFEMAEERLRASRISAGPEFRIGQGFDVHTFGEGDHVILCGVKIPHGNALMGHSDADAGLHALTDALLGAIGDGDIGAHFPPSDPKWRGASSDQFLLDAANRVSARNGLIVNVDVTLICETPKIGPHRQAMRDCIAEILQIDVTRVSVKATTTEGLGFTGRGEGIAAQASAMVQLG